MLRLILKDVPFESQHVPESQPIPNGFNGIDENQEESDYEDGVDETQDEKANEDGVDATQEDTNEDGTDDDEEGVDDTQVRSMNLLSGFVGIHDVHLPTGYSQKHVALNACLLDQILLLLPTQLEDAIFFGKNLSGGVIRAKYRLGAFI
ncbi:unnamed protein product [Lactuca virosa]|uniref:Uncharacterized protein n=1 Tax=Lactuca virosa TaxID=75947 RepID=A0AAU9PA78_9ASTR|nr:unnamed protein product [Lactuca virosa]